MANRCLYNSSLKQFYTEDESSLFGQLCDNYHGDALTTTREAWKGEISILKEALVQYESDEGQIVFEYDIPRLGKKIDFVLSLWAAKTGCSQILLPEQMQTP